MNEVGERKAADRSCECLIRGDPESPNRPERGRIPTHSQPRSTAAHEGRIARPNEAVPGRRRLVGAVVPKTFLTRNAIQAGADGAVRSPPFPALSQGGAVL